MSSQIDLASTDAAKDDVQAFKQARHDVISVILLCVLNTINYADRFLLAGVLPDVQSFFSISNTKLGFIQTCFIVSYMIAAPVFGYYGDRMSRKNLMTFSIAVWSCSTLLGSFIPKMYYTAFIMTRALVGIGEASFMTIAPTIIADLYAHDRRSKSLALFFFAIPIGSGLGYIVGSQAAYTFGSWQWSLRITPVIGILGAVLTFLFLREPPRGDAEGQREGAVTSIREDIINLYRTKSYLWSTLGFTTMVFASGALAWWGPRYMEISMTLEVRKTSFVGAFLTFGITTTLAGIFGIVIGCYSSQYFRKKSSKADPLICVTCNFLCVPFLFTALAVANKVVAITWTLMFIAEILLFSNWSIVADILLYVIVPTRRSMAGALQILISHALGDASSPYICGIIEDKLLKNTRTHSTVDTYVCLQYALYLPVSVLLLGSLCFYNASTHIEKDRLKCTQTSQGTTVRYVKYTRSTNDNDKCSILPTTTASEK